MSRSFSTPAERVVSVTRLRPRKSIARVEDGRRYIHGARRQRREQIGHHQGRQYQVGRLRISNEQQDRWMPTHALTIAQRKPTSGDGFSVKIIKQKNTILKHLRNTNKTQVQSDSLSKGQRPTGDDLDHAYILR